MGLALHKRDVQYVEDIDLEQVCVHGVSFSLNFVPKPPVHVHLLFIKLTQKEHSFFKGVQHHLLR